MVDGQTRETNELHNETDDAIRLALLASNHVNRQERFKLHATKEEIRVLPAFSDLVQMKTFSVQFFSH